MDGARRQRYLDKLEHADRRLTQAAEWRAEAEGREAVRLGRYKAFQEAVEAVTDLAAMMLVDQGHGVHDDYRNLEVLADLGVVSRSLLPALTRATGLRNRLVHEYNGLDARKADEGMDRSSAALREFLEGVERWLTSMK